MKMMQLSCTSGPVMANGAFLAVVVEFGDKLIFVRFPWVGCVPNAFSFFFFFFTEKEHNFQKKLYRITSP